MLQLLTGYQERGRFRKDPPQSSYGKEWILLAGNLEDGHTCTVRRINPAQERKI